tara:strand:- start:114 stop:467 length:354 start_codon:yes stop_codon:yes gene_type:complete
MKLHKLQCPSCGNSHGKYLKKKDKMQITSRLSKHPDWRITFTEIGCEFDHDGDEDYTRYVHESFEVSSLDIKSMIYDSKLFRVMVEDSYVECVSLENVDPCDCFNLRGEITKLPLDD